MPPEEAITPVNDRLSGRSDFFPEGAATLILEEPRLRPRRSGGGAPIMRSLGPTLGQLKPNRQAEKGEKKSLNGRRRHPPISRMR